MPSLLVDIAELTRSQRDRIAAAAGARGWEANFASGEASRFLAVNAEVIFCQNPALLKAAEHLKWLNVPSAGAEQYLDAALYASPGAVLTNSAGAYGVTIAEHVLMVLLEILRRQPEYSAHIARREWVRRLPVRAIYGSRVTLLGTGDIGRETLKRLRGFAPERIVGVNRGGRNPDGLFDRVVSSAQLDDVLPETDILIISLPGTPETLHMIAERQLELLPDEAVLINVGRGAVVDQAALEAELRGGRLYAGLDVFETEPIPPESTLWSAPRLIITPHVAGDTTLPHTLERIFELFLEDLENYCAGRPLIRLVDRNVGY